MNDFTVHIVSQRLLFRKTFRKLVSLLDTDVVCQDQASVVEVLAEIPAPGEGAVIVDCGAMGVDEVIACVLQCLTEQPEATVILILDEQDDAVIEAGMGLGAMGVIIKASPPQVIVDSLQRILTGERCRPAPMIDIPSTDIPENMRAQLSARQQKMLRAIMGGQSISATARQLGITPAKLVGEMRLVIATIRGRVF